MRPDRWPPHLPLWAASLEIDVEPWRPFCVQSEPDEGEFRCCRQRRACDRKPGQRMVVSDALDQLRPICRSAAHTVTTHVQLHIADTPVGHPETDAADDSFPGNAPIFHHVREEFSELVCVE